MIKRVFSVIALIICVLGCAHDESMLEDSDRSLGEIKKAIYSVIGEPRGLSQNQREFTSHYFDKADAKTKDRFYYVVTILGSRRPYSIEIHAINETKVGKGYEPNGEDSVLAKKVLKELEQKLHQGRDGRNLIDDFRAF